LESREQQIEEYKRQIEELMKENANALGLKEQAENNKFILQNKLVFCTIWYM